MIESIPRFGAIVEDRGVRFRLFTTKSNACFVRLFESDGNPEERLHPLAQTTENVFESVLPNARVGSLYKFVLSTTDVPDPYARFLPFGVDGPAMVVDPNGYTWKSAAAASRPLREQVIYELHIGTFTDEGTYRAAVDRLPYLADLGVTTIELMPVSAFAGLRGWGYDGVALYAPFAPYGTPDELKGFVDAAHEAGLQVVLDVVYNHFGPAGNYLSAYSQRYFTHDAVTLWGDAPNFGDTPMRDYVLGNAHYWLEEFRFDGLRLDATHAIVDTSKVHVLRELADLPVRKRSKKVLIAEDNRDDPTLVTQLGMDATWADDFHHQLHVTLTGERDGYYASYEGGTRAIAATIARGFGREDHGREISTSDAGRLPAEAFVYCLQNHDQVGNRALGERITKLISVDAYCAASTLLLFLPMTPLLFMGQEWSASTPFFYFTDHDKELGAKVSKGRRDEFKAFASFSNPEARKAIPDPQAASTFVDSKLVWREREEPNPLRVWTLYRQLLALRRDDAVLRLCDRNRLRAQAEGDLVIVERWGLDERDRRTLVVNFGNTTAVMPSARSTSILFSTAHTDHGPPDAPEVRGNEAVIFASMP